MKKKVLDRVIDWWERGKIENMQKRTERMEKRFAVEKEYRAAEKKLASLRPAGENSGVSVWKGLRSNLADFGEYSAKVADNLNKNVIGGNYNENISNKKQKD